MNLAHMNIVKSRFYDLFHVKNISSRRKFARNWLQLIQNSWCHNRYMYLSAIPRSTLNLIVDCCYSFWYFIVLNSQSDDVEDDEGLFVFSFPLSIPLLLLFVYLIRLYAYDSYSHDFSGLLLKFSFQKAHFFVYKSWCESFKSFFCLF